MTAVAAMICCGVLLWKQNVFFGDGMAAGSFSMNLLNRLIYCVPFPLVITVLHMQECCYHLFSLFYGDGYWY